MALRIIEDPAQLDQAYAALHASLSAWAGAKAHAWTSQDALEPGGEGATYARRDDLHIFLERTSDRVTLGVALTEKDRDLVSVAFSRAKPASRKHRAAIAVEDNGEFHLLLAADALKDHDIREPFRRLAGAPLIKRAEVGGRDYLLAGPLNAPRIADALCAIAGLSPAFERHVAQLGKIVADEDEVQETALYRVSRNIARAHRVTGRVIAALHQKLAGAGFQIDAAEAGGLKADFAMSRGAESLVFEIRRDAEIADLVRGLGQLALVAPRPAALTRVMVLPSPEDDMGEALAPFMPALEELSVNLLLFEIGRDGVAFRFDRVDPALPAETRRLFDER